MSLEKTLYVAHATATGGRDGRAVSSDEQLNVSLATPRELGGAGGAGTNPEQLFAAGYAACFIGALKFVAAKEKVALPAETAIAADVGIGPLPTGFGIEVTLNVSVPGNGARAGRSAGAEGAHCLPLLERDARQYRRDAQYRLIEARKKNSRRAGVFRF